MSDIILQARSVRKHFPVRQGLFLKVQNQVRAVDDVSLEVRQGETLGLVGESGCGKSTLGRCLIRLYEPSSGQIEFLGKDFLGLSGQELRQKRREVQMIFQDPYSSLNPRMTVGQILEEPFRIHGVGSSQERQAWVQELLKTVGLKSSQVNRYPHEFSGGQKQRICIARALALKPKLIIADEPVSALDVSIQAQILNLLKELQQKMGLTYIFISHDLSVIEHICDRVAVMYLGKIVEMATRDELFQNPRHPYTQALIQAIPKLGGGKKKMQKTIGGEVPSPLNPPSGCHFHPRCPQRMASCDKVVPQLQTLERGHQVSCLLFSENQDSSQKGETR